MWILLSNEGNELGKLTFIQKISDWLSCYFESNNDFNSIKHLFIDLNDAANNQLFIQADEIATEIKELNLSIQKEDGSHFLLSEIQVSDDLGAASIKISPA